VRIVDVGSLAPVRTILFAGHTSETLQNPMGITVSPGAEEVFVSDYGTIDGSVVHPEIKVFGYDGSFKRAFSGRQGMLGQRFSRPHGLTIDEGGDLYVVDALAGEVLVLDSETGNSLRTLGGFGNGEGELWMPLDVVIDTGGLAAVTSNRARRIELLPVLSAKISTISAHPIPQLPAGKAALITDHECTYCHSLHGGSTTQLLNNANFEALCMTCHGPGGPSALKAEVHTYTNSTCADCHNAHSNVQNNLGGTNIKLVRDPVYDGSGWRPSVFESRGSSVGDPTLHSFCDDDEDGNSIWDGICDTCHTGMRRHAYTLSNSHKHKKGATCTTSGCHIHATGFDRQ
jgi:predicted CXXCH cytochrome family protein